MIHTVIIEPFSRRSAANPDSPSQRYNVRFKGQLILENSHNPEYEACRVLLGRGITGTLETYREECPYPCLRLDIEQGAKFTIRENEKVGPIRVRYQPLKKVLDQTQNPSVSCQGPNEFPQVALGSI